MTSVELLVIALGHDPGKSTGTSDDAQMSQMIELDATVCTVANSLPCTTIATFRLAFHSQRTLVNVCHQSS